MANRSYIVNHMVEQNENQLNDIFQALADPTRREMIRLMAGQERTVTELAAPFAMSLAAVSKHLKVLERSGLLARRKEGRIHYCSLSGEQLSKAHQWLRMYERLWSRQFDALEQVLKQEVKEEQASFTDKPRKQH